MAAPTISAGAAPAALTSRGVPARRSPAPTIVRVSGMTELTNRLSVPRTWGIAMTSSPSAVWIRRGRTPLREPAAFGVRS